MGHDYYLLLSGLSEFTPSPGYDLSFHYSEFLKKVTYRYLVIFVFTSDSLKVCMNADAVSTSLPDYYR